MRIRRGSVAHEARTDGIRGGQWHNAARQVRHRRLGHIGRVKVVLAVRCGSHANDPAIDTLIPAMPAGGRAGGRATQISWDFYTGREPRFSGHCAPSASRADRPPEPLHRPRLQPQRRPLQTIAHPGARRSPERLCVSRTPPVTGRPTAAEPRGHPHRDWYGRLCAQSGMLGAAARRFTVGLPTVSCASNVERVVSAAVATPTVAPVGPDGSRCAADRPASAPDRGAAECPAALASDRIDAAAASMAAAAASLSDGGPMGSKAGALRTAPLHSAARRAGPSARISRRTARDRDADEPTSRARAGTDRVTARHRQAAPGRRGAGRRCAMPVLGPPRRPA